MASEVLIKVQGVRKKFCRSLKRSLWYGLNDMAAEVLRRGSGGDRLRPGEFWAVDDVSFELRRGECLGLVGRNGAGKTTLLKMLNGLIKPDAGRIELRGRIGGLIALGAGFNPILTGRENIYVNGSVLGLTKKEIDAQIDEIIEFAEIRDFIDAPVQCYSSGMQVRLGFAVATAMKPDVLLLDEVLAVGDAAFRARCFKRIGMLLHDAAVIFVSHDVGQIYRICSEALLLTNGSLTARGNVNDVLRCYKNQGASASTSDSIFVYDDDVLSFELTEARVTGENPCQLELSAQLELSSPKAVGAILVEIERDEEMVCQSEARTHPRSLPAGRSALSITIPHLTLTSGTYAVGINILGEGRRFSVVHAKRARKIAVAGSSGYGSTYNPESYVALTERSPL